jgi:hypothetical protein
MNRPDLRTGPPVEWRGAPLGPAIARRKMLDKDRLGVEDKAVRPEPRRCPGCKAEVPEGRTVPPTCPICGADTRPEVAK